MIKSEVPMLDLQAKPDLYVFLKRHLMKQGNPKGYACALQNSPRFEIWVEKKNRGCEISLKFLYP